MYTDVRKRNTVTVETSRMPGFDFYLGLFFQFNCLPAINKFVFFTSQEVGYVTDIYTSVTLTEIPSFILILILQAELPYRMNECSTLVAAVWKLLFDQSATLSTAQ